MTTYDENTSNFKYYIENVYNKYNYENKVNTWLDKNVETNYYTLDKTNEDITEDFFNKILKLLDNNNYVIHNINSFKDDFIRFVYKYSDE